MKYKIIEKAWIVYHDGMINPGDADFYQSVNEIPVVYAQTRNKAKIKGLYQGEAGSWDLLEKSKHTNSFSPTYIDLKTKRVKGLDKIMFEGQVKTICSVKVIKAEREQILKRRKEFEEKHNKPNSLFCISTGYIGNALMLWRQGKCGYTTHLKEAHLFTYQEILDGYINSLRQNERIWNTNDLIKAAVLVADSNKLNYENCIQ